MRLLRNVTIVLTAWLLTGAAYAVTPQPAWNTQAVVNAGYAAQQTLDASGSKVTKFNPTVLSGIQFWRANSIFGFSVGAAALTDEQQKISRVAPYGAVHLGVQNAQFYIGACYDPQNVGSKAVATFGFTAAFGK